MHPPLITLCHVLPLVVCRLVPPVGFLPSVILRCFITLYRAFKILSMAAAAGKRKTKISSLPSGFQYDLPLLQAAGNHMHADSSGIDNGHDETPRGLPRSEPAALNGGRKPSDLQLLALQIEQQKLEIKKLELEAQARANTDSSLLKPESVPSLSTVRQSPNTGKSLGQLDYNVRIVAPKEWPHLHVPFGLAKKKFKDLSLAEFVYGYLDIMRVAKDEQREIMSSHLMTLMRLAAKYKWHSVLSFHAAVLDRIEAGLASWGDDFTELERFNITESDRLPSVTKQPNQPTARPPANTAKTYCREWNRTGSCSNQSHQVGAEHVCAYCKLSDHTIATCPTRPPSNTPATNTTSA